MTKLNEVFQKMVEGAGLSTSDDNIKKILDNPSLSSIEVDDVTSTKLLAPRMTMESAKNNPDLHKHFMATILNTVDKKVYDSAKEFGLNDDDVNELKGVQSSYDRMIALAKKVQTIEAKKIGAPSKDAEKFNKEIEKLNADILLVSKKYEDEKKELVGKFDEERNGWKLDSVFNQFLPQMDKTKSAKVNLITARTIVNDELQKKGLKIVNKEGNLSIVNSEGLEYHDNNTKVGVDDFVTKTLANEKLLVASNQGNQNTNKNQSQKREISNDGGGKGGLNTSKYLAALDGEAK